MTTITTDRLNERTTNRVAQHVDRLEQDTGFGPPFHCICKDVWAMQPITRCSPASTQKDLVTAFTRGLPIIRQLYADWNQVVKWIVWAGIDCPSRPEKEAKLHEILARHPKLAMPEPDVLTWDLLAENTDVIHARLAEVLRLESSRFVQGIIEGLGRLMEGSVVGYIEQHPRNDTVYRYTYFRPVVRPKTEPPKTSSRTEQRGDEIWEIKVTSWRHQVTHSHQRIEHHIYNTRIDAWNAWMQKPQRITDLLNALPAWFQRYVQIASGDMCREHIVEQDERTERWTETKTTSRKIGEVVRQGRMLSPAVFIGPFVLAGWSDDMR